MSVAFPNGQQPEIPSIIASFADGHPSTNQNPMATNTDSFSGGAAFSFEHHNQTPLFGIKADTQNQMQTQSSNHLMADNNQPIFSSDYDMDTAKDNYVPRDEDFDIDLDIADHDDGDIDLDLATPMGVVEDDEQMGGVATAEEADDEMIDDATAEIHNEEMVDDDVVQRPQPQPQLQQQPLQPPQIRQNSLFGAPAENSSGGASDAPAEKPASLPEILNEQPVLGQETHSTYPSQPLPAEPVATETHPEERSVEKKPAEEETPIEVPTQGLAPEEPVAPVEIIEPQQELPKSPSPRVASPTENMQKPESPRLAPPKQQTPPSSNEAVRISQADTVTIENPTPEVNQREWQAYALINFEGHTLTAEVPPEATHHVNHEIPTSPFNPSEHGSNSHEQLSQSEEHSFHEPAEELNKEATQDPSLTHPVIILYRDTEFSLFPVLGTGLPETTFLPDRSVLTSPLNKLIASLRDVLGNEFSVSEEIVLTFTPLGVEFEEENLQASHISLYELISLYVKLLVQDGVQDVTPLYISLGSRQKCLSKLEMIKAHVAGGGGMFAWNKVSGGLDNLQSLESEPQHYEPTSHFEDHGDEQQEHNTDAEDEHSHYSEEQHVEEQKPVEEGNDDEDLELEEFEKHYDEVDGYYPQEETGNDHPQEKEAEERNVNIDVPKSPSQENKPQPALTREATNTDGSMNVAETQYSHHNSNRESQTGVPQSTAIKDHEAGEHEADAYQDISSINGDQMPSNNDSHLTRDDASFVTAQEKQQIDVSRLRSLSHTGSYGLPASPSSDEEPDYNIDSKDDEELDLNNEEYQKEDEASPAEESKSSSTLHEASDNEPEDHTAAEARDAAAADHHNWDEWAYVEGEEAGEETGEDGFYAGIDHTADPAAPLETYDGLPTFTASGTGGVEGGDEYDDEFAYYPQQFSDFDNPEDGDDNLDEPLLDLEQHETHSATASAKRAREDDDDEEDEGEEETENLGYSPSQASKRLRAL